MEEMKIKFNNLKIPIDDNIFTHSIEIQELVYSYLSGLNNIEIKAINIAHTHLGTSFNILKSIGYMSWIKTHNH
jgi:hypothetical protein